ncbi:hypothetical protein FOL47_009527 [Perkinsus chesapeaki]|uniref:Uncharacterized protein n=1 Tax=Perkinsus chesapeaki TaxID=330153 RepID=A0A7J6MSG0_PERCH|nr:hypothetical protein FOL47_009527 [Perkinsus chesapeaki]
MKSIFFGSLLAALSMSYGQEFPRGHVFSIANGHWQIVVTFESDRDLLYIQAASPDQWLDAFVPYELGDPDAVSIPVHLLWGSPGASGSTYTDFVSSMRNAGLLHADLSGDNPFTTIFLAENDTEDDVLNIFELGPGLSRLNLVPTSTDFRRSLNLVVVALFCSIQSRYRPGRNPFGRSLST